MAAAVADFRPATTSTAKLKKRDLGETMTLELVRNPDVLASLAANRPGPAQIVVGFAAETEGDRDARIALGVEKLAAKGADFLVLNEVGFDRGFGPGDTSVIVLAPGGRIVGEAAGDKSSVASAILDLVVPA